MSEILCAHALTEPCACLPRHPVVYVAPRVEMKAHPEPAWSCQCKRPDGRRLLRNYRHRSPQACLPAEEVAAWRARHLEVKSDGNARVLLWLAREFGGGR